MKSRLAVLVGATAALGVLTLASLPDDWPMLHTTAVLWHASQDPRPLIAP